MWRVAVGDRRYRGVAASPRRGAESTEASQRRDVRPLSRACHADTRKFLIRLTRDDSFLSCMSLIHRVSSGLDKVGVASSSLVSRSKSSLSAQSRRRARLRGAGDQRTRFPSDSANAPLHSLQRHVRPESSCG